jgi:hypothetical protein
LLPDVSDLVQLLVVLPASIVLLQGPLIVLQAALIRWGLRTQAAGLTADLSTTHGYSVSVGPVLDVYFEAVGDAGPQSWEVAKGVSIIYAVTSDAAWRAPAQQNILTSVAGVLATGHEDVTLIHNHDYLLLTRVGGGVHKFRRDAWWARVPQADAIIPG